MSLPSSSQLAALAVSPFCRAMSAAATRLAISAAIDDGDLPSVPPSARSCLGLPPDIVRRQLDLLVCCVVGQTGHPGEQDRERTPGPTARSTPDPAPGAVLPR